MPGNYGYFEESDDGPPDDDEFEDGFPEEEPSDDSESDTVPCPRCGAAVYEDAERCPHCEAYIIHEHRGWSGRPAWWVILGLAGVVAAILALLRCVPG